MPCFDAARFIEEAIESVLAQTLEAWELLLIDDGSTDASPAIARAYARRFSERIRYLEHEGHVNRGKSTSRNLGIAQARGALLTFLDADDVFLPHKLAHQAELLERHPQVVMVYGTTEYWSSWDTTEAPAARDRRGKLGVVADRPYAPPELLAAYLRDPGIVPCICGVLARTTTVRSAGAFDESVQDLYEDQVFLVRMSMRGPVYVESGCGERYRQHPWSSSARAVADGQYHPTSSNPARRKYLEWLEHYLEQVGCSDPRVRRALRKALRPYRHPVLHRLLAPFRFRGV